MCNVKPETDLSEPEFYEATTSGGSTRGLMVYIGLANFFYKVKPPGLNIEADELVYRNRFRKISLQRWI